MQTVESQSMLIDGNEKMDYDGIALGKTVPNENENEAGVGNKARHYWSTKEEEIFFEIWGRDNWRLTLHGKNMKIFNEWSKELTMRLGFEFKPIEIQTKVNQYRLKYRTVIKQHSIDHAQIRWKKFHIIDSILKNKYRNSDAEEIPIEYLKKNRDIPYVEKTETLSMKQNNSNSQTYTNDEYQQHIKTDSPIDHYEQNNEQNNYDMNLVGVKNESQQFQPQNNTNEQHIYQYQSNIQQQQQQLEQHLINSNYNTQQYQYQSTPSPQQQQQQPTPQQSAQHIQQQQCILQQQQPQQQQQQQHILTNTTNYTAVTPVIQKNQHIEYWNQQTQPTVPHQIQTQQTLLQQPLIVQQPKETLFTYREPQPIIRNNNNTTTNTNNTNHVNFQKKMKIAEIPKYSRSLSTTGTTTSIQNNNNTTTTTTLPRIKKRRMTTIERPIEIDMLVCERQENMLHEKLRNEKKDEEITAQNIEKEYLIEIRKRNNILLEQSEIAEKRLKLEDRKINLMEKFFPKCLQIQEQIMQNLTKHENGEMNENELNSNLN